MRVTTPGDTNHVKATEIRALRSALQIGAATDVLRSERARQNLGVNDINKKAYKYKIFRKCTVKAKRHVTKENTVMWRKGMRILYTYTYI